MSRLAALGQQALQRQLPVEVVEILGFGSFFRGKQRPKDVDLLIRYARDHGPAFNSFRAILEQVAHDVQNQYDFDRPLEAFLAEYDRRHANMLPRMVSVDEERELFQRWLEPYSWTMLFPKTVADACAWDDPCGFTRRLLRRTLPNVNVAYFIFPDMSPEELGLRAGFTELIWSRERPDISANILAALAPEKMLVNTQKDFRNFDRQLFRLRATLRMLEQFARRALKEPSPEPESRLRRSVLCQETLMTENEILQELNHAYQRRDVDELPASELGDLVEEYRAEVKKLWNTVEGMRQVIWAIDWYWRAERRPRVPVEEFVAAEFLAGKPSSQRKLFGTLLSNIGIVARDVH